ncbi:hypothetical protein L7F22_025180 [Adiantum nelumboides]|nr:hypothetical protein [Adiantum nelumboides]
MIQEEEPSSQEAILEVRSFDYTKLVQTLSKVDVPILMIQEEEPSSQEAILEVRSFDYTKLIQTLSIQFQCQQVVAKETEIQKTRTNQAQEEIANLRTALEMVTKERDSSARENENLIRDLMDLQSQLTRKEAQNHELIKNEKKMKEQIKYEDVRFQKLNASYNTVKNTLIALLQNQELATIAPSISDSAALNTLAALQAKLQVEKLQRQLLVSGFMSQTAQHKAKVKQLEEELAKAKAELAVVGSLALTSHIQQAETRVLIQPPQLPEMPEFQGIEEEEQQRPGPRALDIREEIEQEIEDLPEGPAKEYLMYKKKVMQSAALAFLQPEEQIKDFGNDFLPLPLMRHEAILWKEKMRPTVPRNEDGGYEGIPLTTEEAKTLIEDHFRWRRKWLSERPRDLTNFHNTPQSLQIDPTYCPVPRRRTWAEFQKWKGKNKALLNYPILSAQEPPTANYVVNTLNTTIQLLREVPDIACQMLVKIARMIVTCIQDFWFETVELVSFIVQDRLLLFGSDSGLVSLWLETAVTGQRQYSRSLFRFRFVSGSDLADLVHWTGLASAVIGLVTGQCRLVSASGIVIWNCHCRINSENQNI